MCTIHGINNQPFTGTLTFEVPVAVLLGQSGQSYERLIPRDESSLELTVASVALTETGITRSEVAELEIGDLLITEINPASLLTATIDGLPAYRGTMGIFQGRKALRVAEKVANPA